MLFSSFNRVLAYVLLASAFYLTANADSATDALSQIPACGVGICILQEKYRADFRTARMYCREYTRHRLRSHRCRVSVQLQKFNQDLATMLGKDVHIRSDLWYVLSQHQQALLFTSLQRYSASKPRFATGHTIR
jgi:hypothetical protein